MVSCSVYGCSNRSNSANNQDTPIHLYRFPKNPPERKEKWIRFAARKNPDGSKWEPKEDDSSSTSRFNRLANRNVLKESLEHSKTFSSTTVSETPAMLSVEVQTDFGNVSCHQGRLSLFISNIGEQNSSTQVTHEGDNKKVLTKNAKVNTFQGGVAFYGFESLDNSSLLKLTSVSLNNFKFLLSLLPDYHPRTLTKEDNLIAFLIKFKSSSSSIAPFFSTNEVTMRNNKKRAKKVKKKAKKRIIRIDLHSI